MLKSLLAFALVLPAPLAAAGVGQEIAYVKAGTYNEIYLIESDGTRKKLLYRSPQRLRIFTLDMKPGGGELAFEEVACCSVANAQLKVVTFDNNGTRLATRSLNVCRISSLDYHPTDGDLLYQDSCVGTRRLNTTTMASTPVAVPPGINKVGWRSASELVYNRSTPSASEILVAPLASPASATLVGEVRLAGSMDIATSGSSLLVDPVDYGTLSLFDMASGIETRDWQIGHYGHSSPDDQRVLYLSGSDVRGQYLFIRNTDGSGAPFALVGKVAFGPVDWRN